MYVLTEFLFFQTLVNLRCRHAFRHNLDDNINTKYFIGFNKSLYIIQHYVFLLFGIYYRFIQLKSINEHYYISKELLDFINSSKTLLLQFCTVRQFMNLCVSFVRMFMLPAEKYLLQIYIDRDWRLIIYRLQSSQTNISIQVIL